MSIKNPNLSEKVRRNENLLLNIYEHIEMLEKHIIVLEWEIEKLKIGIKLDGSHIKTNGGAKNV